MCDLICDVISFCLWSCDTGKSIYMIKSWLKAKKIWKKKEFFYKNPHLKDGLEIDFTAC